jgi:hypothetical protein
MKSIIIFSLLCLCLSIKAFNQDSLQYFHSLTINPFNLFENTLSLSYYKTISKDREFEFNPRIRIANDGHAGNVLFSLKF